MEDLKEMYEFVKHFKEVLGKHIELNKEIEEHNQKICRKHLSNENTKTLKERIEWLNQMKEHSSYMENLFSNYKKELENHCDSKEEQAEEKQPEWSSWVNVIEETPIDDQTVLVSWVDGKGEWQGPISAFYDEDDNMYYPLDNYLSFPINCEIWCPMPKFPGEEL